MIYYVLFIGLFLTSFSDLFVTDKKIKNRLYLIWLVIFLLFRGLRWDTGCDFPQFYNVFQESSWTNIFSFWRYGYGSERMESGYIFLNVLIKSIIPSYTIFLLLTDAFILYSFSMLIKKFSPGYYLLALSLMMITVEPFPVRQTIATGILCFSFLFAYNRDLKKFIISVLLATTIHSSSVIMLPVFWVTKIKYDYKQIVFYLFLVLGRGFLQTHLMDLFSSNIISNISGGLSETYFITNESIENFNIASIANSLITLLLLIYSKKQMIKKGLSTDVINFFSNLYFVYICFNVLASIPGIEIFYRLSNNFIVAYPICIIFIFKTISFHNLLIATCIFIGFWFIKFKANPCFDEKSRIYKRLYSPYYSIFESNGGNLIRNKPWPYHNR